MDISLNSIQSYIQDFHLSELTASPVPEVILGLGGLLAFLMAFRYMRAGGGLAYRLKTLLGVIGGLVMMVTVYALQAHATGEWSVISMALLGVTGFALFFRPFRTMNLAVILAIVAAVGLYLFLGTLTDPAWEFLTDDVIRAVIALAAAVIIFTAMRFVQELITFVSKIVNAWPILLLLGLLCMGEAAALYMDTTLLELVEKHVLANL